MSRFSKSILCIATAALLAACAPKAEINGTIESAPSSEVIVKLLNVNRYEVLDTVSTNASGKFTYKVEVEETQPEFIYLFYKDTKIASLLLNANDKISVKADTLGNFEVSGSEESVKLAQVERDYASAFRKLTELSDQYDNADEKDKGFYAKELRTEYIKYCRQCTKYIIENNKSLTSVPVLFQNFGPELPVFGQITDAIHFVNTADSLETVYPESKYVKALRKEAERRFGILKMDAQIENAAEIGYYDIELPDINSKKIKLSELDSKVIMLLFWNPADASQKMFNLDVLRSIYDDYHKRGFEIYQVALAADKVQWAQVVKQQNLPWINVCDGLAGRSQYARLYNIPALPATFIIADGELVDGEIIDEKSVRKLLNKLLK